MMVCYSVQQVKFCYTHKYLQCVYLELQSKESTEDEATTQEKEPTEVLESEENLKLLLDSDTAMDTEEVQASSSKVTRSSGPSVQDCGTSPATKPSAKRRVNVTTLQKF